MHWIDPTSLLETSGTVELFLLNPRGESDGFVMADGTEVHFPPHLAAQVHKALKVGEKVKVRGLRARLGDVLAAVSIENEAGKIVVDDGPPDSKRPKPSSTREQILLTGTVRRPLHGPKGEVRGALLEDGHMIRFPPHEADKFKKLLKPGTLLSVFGKALTNRFGTVIEADEIGSKATTRKPVLKPAPAHKNAHGPGHKQPARRNGSV